MPLVEAVRSSEPVYLPSVGAIEARFPGLAERQQRLGTRSMAAIPLQNEGSCVGGLLFSDNIELVLSSEQQAFLAAFAAQVAQGVMRGLAYQVQHTNSEQLQRSLMPYSLPEVAGLNLGAHYQSGGINVDVGGDWYDVLHTDDGAVVLTLGDVMGKGAPAAVVMSEIRAATRAYALIDPTPRSCSSDSTCSSPICRSPTRWSPCSTGWSTRRAPRSPTRPPATRPRC